MRAADPRGPAGARLRRGRTRDRTCRWRCPLHGYGLLVHPLARPVALIVGALLLLAGRRLFWLLVGAIGFLFAYSLSLRYLHLQPSGGEWLVAILVGVLGVVLAIFAQKLAIALAGFGVGVYLAAGLLGFGPRLSGLHFGQALALVAAGVVAAVLAVVLFDLALSVLSALAGSGLVVDALGLGGTLRWPLFVVLAIVGTAVQLGAARRSRE